MNNAFLPTAAAACGAFLCAAAHGSGDFRLPEPETLRIGQVTATVVRPPAAFARAESAEAALRLCSRSGSDPRLCEGAALAAAEGSVTHTTGPPWILFVSAKPFAWSTPEARRFASLLSEPPGDERLARALHLGHEAGHAVLFDGSSERILVEALRTEFGPDFDGADLIGLVRNDAFAETFCDLFAVRFAARTLPGNERSRAARILGRARAAGSLPSDSEAAAALAELETSSTEPKFPEEAISDSAIRSAGRLARFDRPEPRTP